jgi:hypothetical protein
MTSSVMASINTGQSFIGVTGTHEENFGFQYVCTILIILIQYQISCILAPCHPQVVQHLQFTLTEQSLVNFFKYDDRKEQIELGIFPSKFVESNSRFFKAVSFPSSVGMVPFRLRLLFSCKNSRRKQCPSSDGIAP